MSPDMKRDLVGLVSAIALGVVVTVLFTAWWFR